ncbi:uncharacterized protein [Primulina eburnea]|uniref:uncharacterized protein n=1 Tax=Primulina eburnea TaxID=1245227 RepID=UPI003C6CC3DE
MQHKRQHHQQSSQQNKKPFMGPPRAHGQQKPQGQVKKPGPPKPSQPRPQKPIERPLYKECNRSNFGKCMWGTYKCFICKEKGHKAADCQKKKAPTVGRAYVMHAEKAEEELDMTLITGRLFIPGVATYALLDSRAINSFISETFVKRLDITPEDIRLSFKVSIPSGDQMITSSIVKNLEHHFQKDVAQADLIVLPMPEFDIILGMDWLSLNGASIDFWQMSVSIRPPSRKSFVFEPARNKKMPHIISCMCVEKLMRRGCQAFLACVTSAHVLDSQNLEDVEVVRDFPSVFLEDVSVIPPDREGEFSIELMSGIVPIF